MQSTSALPARQGVLYVATAATAWGTGGAVAAQLYDVGGLDPVSVSFWRFLTGFGVLVAAHLARRVGGTGTGVRLRAVFTADPRRTLVTGAGLALYQTAYFAAVQEAGLTLATVVTLGSGPVLVAVGGRFVLAERIGVAGVAATCGGVAGLVLLVGSTGGVTGPDPRSGVALALLSAAGYAGVTLLGRARGLGGAGGAFEATVTGFAVGTVCLLPVAVVAGLLPHTGRVGWTLGLIGYLGTVPTALAYSLFFAALGVVRAATASVIALVEPIAAAAIGIAAFGERLTQTGAAGTALLLGAVVVLAVGERTRPHREESVPGCS